MQALALNLYRHISSSSNEQKAEYEKVIDSAAEGMKRALTAYEKLARTEQGKALLEKEKVAVSEYFKLLPAVLERSRANDSAGALDKTTAMAANRAVLVRLIDEHVALNDSLAQAQAEQIAEYSYRQSDDCCDHALGYCPRRCNFFCRDLGINRSLSSMQSAIVRIEGEPRFLSPYGGDRKGRNIQRGVGTEQTDRKAEDEPSGNHRLGKPDFRCIRTACHSVLSGR